MNNPNNDKPAFPMVSHVGAVGGSFERAIGMTIREYFAAKAMQGLLANPAVVCRLTDILSDQPASLEWMNKISIAAGQAADIQLSELNKKGKE